MRLFVLPLLLLIELVVFVPYGGVHLTSWNVFADGFASYASDIVSHATPLLILALGMTLVLMTAGIDLSVGSMVALIACVMSLFEGGPLFWVTAVPLGLLLGLALGAFNGIVVSRLDVPPIITTLGTLFFYRGLCNVVMHGRENSPFGSVPGYVWFGEMPGAAITAGVLLTAGGLYFWWSRWRQEILMIGGNRIAARYAAIDVPRRQLQVYSLMGVLAFVAALCASARAGSVLASWQSGLELRVIVAVVLGGTRVDGGHGSIAGSVFGVFLIAILEEGLRGMQQSELIHVFLGVLLVVGVWLNTHAAGGFRASRKTGRRSVGGTAAPDGGANV